MDYPVKCHIKVQLYLSSAGKTRTHNGEIRSFVNTALEIYDARSVKLRNDWVEYKCILTQIKNITVA